MPTYSAYGLVVASDLDLPELTPMDASVPPDVRVMAGPVEWGAAATPDRVVGQFEDLVRFEITDGTRITVDELRPTPDDVVRARLLGEIFAVLLRQRGLLVVHACAVASDDGAVCLVGESGWGKSTLAEAFCQRGYALLTDDVVAIEPGRDGGPPHVIPSYPQIRLREDAAAFLVPDGDGLTPMSRNGPKVARNGVAMAAEPVPLRALYFLEPGYREQTEIAPVAPTEAVVRLVSHTRARTLIHSNVPALLQDHLEQCRALVQAVSPRLLRRRASFEALPEVLAAIEDDAGVRAPAASVPAVSARR